MIISVSEHLIVDFFYKMAELDISLEYLGRFPNCRTWTNDLGHSVSEYTSGEVHDVQIKNYFDHAYLEYRFRTTSSVDVTTIIMDGTYSSLVDCGILV